MENEEIEYYLPMYTLTSRYLQSCDRDGISTVVLVRMVVTKWCSSLNTVCLIDVRTWLGWNLKLQSPLG